MATLYLHIGMTKTGSTSIEATFHDARKLLLEHGVDYLDMGQNHTKIMLVAARRTAKGLKGDVTRLLGVEKDDVDYDPALVVREIESRFAAPRAPKVVVSGQGILHFARKDVVKLKALADQHFEAVRVIVYVRDPTTWASSRAQENIKRGHSIEALVASVRERPEKSPIMPRYRSGIENWIDVFGREAVDIRVFDRKRFQDGDLLADFCAAIGAPADLARKLPRNWNNKGASAESLYLIMAHYDIVEQRGRKAAGHEIDIDAPGRSHEGFEESDQYRKPPLNFPFRQAIRDIEGTRFALPKMVLDAVWERSAEDIAWLREVTGEPDLFADQYPPKEAPVPAWSKETLRGLAAVIETGLGDVMKVEKRRRRLPKPVRAVWRLALQARRRLGV
ncbi:hypothetical protein [Prosthecomicrobium sp. N25]|uniref:hypothetical protein n=1 Tax=Prosthecomicrobium sp. N25 TaxID=3129254 RepID=UPI003076DA30